MPADQKTMHVRYDATAKHWLMDEKGPDHYPKIDLPKDKVGIYTFQITGPQEFHATTPFEAKAGKANPSDFSYQFQPISLDKKKIIILDNNSNPNGGEYAGGDYIYQLKFSDGTTLDPIITNGGCCGGGTMQSSVLYYSLGAIALLALIVLIARPFLKRR